MKSGDILFSERINMNLKKSNLGRFGNKHLNDVDSVASFYLTV